MFAREFDLFASARQEMIDQGFHPDFPIGVDEQLRALTSRAEPSAGGDVHDLRSLLWSSIIWIRRKWPNESARAFA